MRDKIKNKLKTYSYNQLSNYIEDGFDIYEYTINSIIALNIYFNADKDYSIDLLNDYLESDTFNDNYIPNISMVVKECCKVLNELKIEIDQKSISRKK